MGAGVWDGGGEAHLTHTMGAAGGTSKTVACPDPPSHPTSQYRLLSSIRNLHIVPRTSRPSHTHTPPSTSQAISSYLPLSATSSNTSCSSGGAAPTAAAPTGGSRRRQLLQACHAYINVLSYITLQVRVIENEEGRGGAGWGV